METRSFRGVYRKFLGVRADIHKSWTRFLSGVHPGSVLQASMERPEAKTRQSEHSPIARGWKEELLDSRHILPECENRQVSQRTRFQQQVIDQAERRRGTQWKVNTRSLQSPYSPILCYNPGQKSSYTWPFLTVSPFLPTPFPPPHTMLAQWTQIVPLEATLYGRRGEGQVWEKEPLSSSNKGRWWKHSKFSRCTTYFWPGL